MDWVDKIPPEKLSKYDHYTKKGIIERKYDGYIYRPFPKYKRDLPIIAPDNSYTMDIMFFSTVLQEDIDNRRRFQRRLTGDVIRVEDGDNATLEFAPQYESALIFVETTSRFAIAIPMHGKDSKEVLFCFKRFLEAINFNIACLTSDSGKEYSLVKKFLDAYDHKDETNTRICKYYQVNSTQNHHTALSRVDRFVRTLRSMIAQYYNYAMNGDWTEVLDLIIDNYNRTKHGSLWLKGPDKDGKIQKFYYTPRQVFNNPELRRRIKIKDYLQKYKNYKKIDSEAFNIGRLVYYRVTSSKMKDRNRRGFISQYPAKIVDRIGNSFKIQLMGNGDISDNNYDHLNETGEPIFTGNTIIVPFRDLIPADDLKPFNSRFKLKELFEKIKKRSDTYRGNPDYDFDDFPARAQRREEEAPPPPAAAPPPPAAAAEPADDDDDDYDDDDDEDYEDEEERNRFIARPPKLAPLDIPPPPSSHLPVRRPRRSADAELYEVNRRSVAEPGSRRIRKQPRRYSDSEEN